MSELDLSNQDEIFRTAESYCNKCFRNSPEVLTEIDASVDELFIKMEGLVSEYNEQFSDETTKVKLLIVHRKSFVELGHYVLILNSQNEFLDEFLVF